METEIWKLIITQGPFAALFLWLLVTTKKDSKEREKQLYQTIADQNDVLKKFSEKYDVIISELRTLKDKVAGK